MMNDSKLHEFYAPIKDAALTSTIQWLTFDTNWCEECGIIIMAPNSMHLSEPMARDAWPSEQPLPDEDGGYSDTLGGVCCSACWVA